MGYIVVSNEVYKEVNTRYKEYCEDYYYTMVLDEYLRDLLSFEGEYRLYNRCWNDSTYAIVGKGCMLYLEKYYHFKNCFYAKNVKFFEKDEEYLSKLVQTMELPGVWDIVSQEEIYNIEYDGSDELLDILSKIKGSYGELEEFEKKWKTWDIYNSMLKEAEAQREIESESVVDRVVLENNVFTVYLTVWKKQYIEEASVFAVFTGNEKYINIGKIISFNAKEQEIRIRCENLDLIKEYLANRIGRMEKIRIIDWGTITRLKRQREAMKKLFQEETANANLKDIIMGTYEFKQNQSKSITMDTAYELFGANIRQKEAYIEALNADDIYLIQGPPGTGKTTIITEIVKYVIEKGARVLVASETNIAVDNVLEKIQYIEQVIPVRLGREERIGQECVRFMPEYIAKSILQDAKNVINEFEEEGLNLDNLIRSKEEEYKKELATIIKEVSKKKSNIPEVNDYRALYHLIDEFERLVLDVNDIYMELCSQQKDYIRLKEKRNELQKRKNELDAFVLIGVSKVMDSGFKEADNEVKINLEKYQEELQEINRQLDNVNKKLLANTYETKKGPYQRKLRRIEREKDKLQKLLAIEASFMESIHNIKSVISEIFYLEAQKEHCATRFRDEMERIRTDYEHKKELWEKSADIRAEWLDVINQTDTRKNIENIYMRKTNVVFATCTGISGVDNGKFSTLEYDYVIIDEAAKCNMLDLIIPLILGKKLILVGDHKQLYPMLDLDEIKDRLSKEQIQMLKEHILFKWLYEERVSDSYKKMLNRQYRMVPDICKFVSDYFYNGALICEKESNDKNSIWWIDCENSEEEPVGRSYANCEEADVIVRLVKKLDLMYQKGTTVGIICTYKAQVQKILKLLEAVETTNINLECSTVDAFQGKEKHTIIFNIVRSAKVTDFMSDENRVNVAVSRAQEALYVIGKKELVKTKGAGILCELFKYIKDNGEVHSSRYVNV